MTGGRSPWTLDWALATSGALTSAQRRAMLLAITRGFLDYVAGRARSWFPGSLPPMPEPTIPDSKLAGTAIEAAAEQSPDLIGHGYRTWLLGGCLSALDERSIDPELFFVASLLHDVGLATAVAGQDFTIRSAQAVQRVCDGIVDPDRTRAAADAVIGHASPGMTPDADPLAFYVQAGAMADLTGLRSWHLSWDQVRSIYARHPRHEVHRRVANAAGREAKAVPQGRFALLTQFGFPLLIRLSPTRTL